MSRDDLLGSEKGRCGRQAIEELAGIRPGTGQSSAWGRQDRELGRDLKHPLASERSPRSLRHEWVPLVHAGDTTSGVLLKPIAHDCCFIQYHSLMDAPLLQEVVLRSELPPQGDLPLATEGVLRYVWGSRWGEMLIEVVDGVAYVNGQRVEPAHPMPADTQGGPR